MKIESEDLIRDLKIELSGYRATYGGESYDDGVINGLEIAIEIAEGMPPADE